MAEAKEWTKDIELSDDDEDIHPNIDVASYIRWRHENRLRRMAEMALERKDINAKKEKLKSHKKILEQKRATGENVASLEKAYTADARKLIERELELVKKEKASPWNVDTLGHEGFSKTVINSTSKPDPPPPSKKEVSSKEKGERLGYFLKEKTPLVKEFGMLRKFKDSKTFLQEHPELVSDEACSVLALWCMELAIEKKMDLMDHVSYQCVSMQFLLRLAKELDTDPMLCLNPFFLKMEYTKDIEYLLLFNKELNRFRDRVRQRAVEKVKEHEEEERQKRLGPGGLDPWEVIDSLPEAMQKCFRTEDIPLLHKVISEMPEPVARYHMQRCIDSGMWRPQRDDQGDDSSDGEGAAAKTTGSTSGDKGKQKV